MARDRSMKLIITAQVAGAKRALNETADAAKRVGQAADDSSKRAATAGGRMVQSARDNQQAWNTAGTTLTAFGAGAALALGGAAKAAVDWESAWTGVAKTVDGSASQMAGLEDSLRGMARELPATHGEIAAVAEAAGQLGIKTPDIAGFTEVMIGLGSATDLTSDQAATGIAQIMNVMGTASEDTDNFASTLVALGNAGASTESQILDMAQRLSGAGNLIGASEGEVLALASAMASVGIESQLGGAAMSRAMISMNSAVTSGSDKVAAFAEVAGMSADDFAEKWKADPVSAVNDFVAGLDRVQSQGGDAAGILSDVGLKGTENAQVFLRLSGATDLVSDSLELQKTAWADNTALAEETGRRYETTASKLEMAKNSVVDMGISLGETFMPAIAAASEGGADLAGWLADLPPLAQGAVAGLGGVTATVGLVGGGFFLMLPRLIDSYDAFRDLSEISPRLSSNLGKVGKVVAVGGGMAVGLTAVATGLQLLTQSSWDAAPGVEEITRALLEMQDSGNAGQLDALIDQMGIIGNGTFVRAAPIDSLADAINRLDNPTAMQRMEDLDKVLPGVQTSGDRAAEALSAVDGALAQMVSRGDVAGAQESLASALSGTGIGAEQAMEHLPGYREALIGLENESRVAAESTGGLGDILAGAAGQLREAGDAATEVGEEAREALEQWQESLTGTVWGFVNWGEALGTVQAQSREWAEGQAEATESAKDSWEDFYDGTSVNLENWLTDLERMSQAQEDWAINMTRLSGRVSETVLAELEKLGPEGAPLVAELVNATDEELARLESVFRKGAGDGVGGFVETFTDLSSRDVMKAAFRQLGEDAYFELAEALTAGEITLQEAIDKYDLDVDLGADPTNFGLTLGATLGEANESSATVDILGDDALAQGVRLGFLEDTNTSEATVTLLGDDELGQGVRLGFVDDINDSEGTVDIRGDDDLGDSTLGKFLVRINSSDGTVEVYADTDSADESMRGFFTRHDGRTIKMGVSYGFNSGGGYADGGLIRYADGGIGWDQSGRPIRRESQMIGPRFGKTNVMWPAAHGRGAVLAGEPETDFEAFISGKRGKRKENIGYWWQTGRLLGLPVDQMMGAHAFASGGFASPMGLTIDTAMSGSASRWVDALEGGARKWAASQTSRGGVNYGGPYGWNPNGMSFPQIAALIKALVPNAVITSTFRPGAVTASGVPSLHGLGRAVDWYVPGFGAPMLAAYHRVGAAKRWSQNFYTPAGRASQQGYWDTIIGAMHHDHAHTAMVDGGILDALTRAPQVADTGYLKLQRGWNPPTYNGLGREEHLVDVTKLGSAERTVPVLSRADLDYLADRINRGTLTAQMQAVHEDHRLSRS